MRNKVLNLLLFVTSLCIIVCISTIYFLEYEKVAIILLIVVLILDITLLFHSSIKLRYRLMRGKKAIIYADVSNSKLIKLYYGKKISNKIFDEVADKIYSNVKNGCVKRKYKDHFVILINYNSKNDIINLVNKINKEIQNIKYDEIFNLTIKFGIQICNNEVYEVNENKAGLACNIAKRNAINVYSFYDDEEAEFELNEKKVLNNLINALKNNDFEVYYQPKYDYKLSKVVGSEALIRLKQNDKIVQAKDFIEIAEKYSFTVLLDKFVLKEVCKKIQELKKKKLDFNVISINVSRNTLCEKDMIEYYSKVLNEYGIKRNEIELEVTERDSNITSDLSDVIHNLCKKFNVSIDDFGIGNSSLSMLSENKIKTIKIDRKFVIDESESGRKILNNIIKLSKDLGFELIAEGVETKEQYDYLKSKGCNVIQGYYYSKPLKFDDYVDVLSNGR